MSRDASAKLIKEDLIGDGVLDIQPGTPGLRTVAANGVLPFERGRDLAELAEDLNRRVQPILDNVQKITAEANDPKSDIRQTIRNVSTASAALAETGEKSKALVEHIDQHAAQLTTHANKFLGDADAGLNKLLPTVNATMQRAETLTTHADAAITEVQGKLAGTLDKADESLDNVRAASADARKLMATTAEELPPVVRDGRALAEDSRQLLNGAKRSWPFRNMLPLPQENALSTDSYVSPAETAP